MFGPLRSCIYPRFFCSTNVRKATTSRIGTISEMILNIIIMLGKKIQPLRIKV